MRKSGSQGLVALAAVVAASVAWGQDVDGAQHADSADRGFQQAARDAWIDGRLEGAYIFNDHLSAAAIETHVRSGVVTLTGTVESDIDRDLAGQIAEGLNGVASVDNRLHVVGEPLDAGLHDPSNDSDASSRERVGAAVDDDGVAEAQERRTFGQWVNDATTSAAVKSALIGEDDIRARDIDVDTKEDVVTLRGTVATDEQKQLAEQLAKNTRDVAQVRNELRVTAD